MSRKLVTKAEPKPAEDKGEKKVDVKDFYKDPELVEFDFGSIVLTCKCGKKQTLMEHVEHGIQFIIATNNKAGITLHCDECHSELRLSCEEGTPPPDVDATTPPPEAEKEPEKTETTDENIPQENKEGESV